MCQDPTGDWTARSSSDDRKETQAAMAWLDFLFIGSDQNHLVRHSERGKKTQVDKGRGGKRTAGNGHTWSLASPKRRKQGEGKILIPKVIYGIPMNLAIKGWMMIIMNGTNNM